MGRSNCLRLAPLCSAPSGLVKSSFDKALLSASHYIMASKRLVHRYTLPSGVQTSQDPLANLIHHCFQGETLNEEVNAAIDYAREKFPSLLLIIMKLKQNRPPFRAFKFDEYAAKTLSATGWWKSHSSVLDSDISAMQLLLPATASSCV